MNTLKEYWWGCKFALRTYILWYIAFSTGVGLLVYAIDFVGGGDVVKTLVVLPLTGIFLLKVGQKLRTQWPPSEEKIKGDKKRQQFGGSSRRSRPNRSSYGSGVDVIGYKCENCGKRLDDDWKIVLTSQGYTCENCDHRLKNQTKAGIVQGSSEEDDGSNPAPWDDDYGDPAPWDDDDSW